MSEAINYTAEGEAFGANYADGLMLGFHGRDITDEEAQAMALAYARHLFEKRVELSHQGIGDDDLDMWYKGGMAGFHRRLGELQSAASLADRWPSQPQ